MIAEVGGGGEEWVELVTDEAWSSTRTGGGGGSTWWRRTVGHRGDCCVRRTRQIDPDGHTRWVAPRRRGDALLFSRRSSSTENSVVVTTLYSLILTLRTRPPRQGYATVTSVCCLRLNQVSNLPMRDLCVGCSVRGPGVVRRVGGLCPGGVRCGVSL